MGLTLMEREDAQLSLDLTPDEQAELALCEAVIDKGRQTFLEVGGALTTIQEKRLYRATHDTFETYLREKWEISRTHAYDLIAAYGIVEDVRDSGQSEILPTNPAQALALRNVEEQERGQVWDTAVSTAPEGKLTAAHIQETANKHLGKPETEKPVLEKPDTSNLLKPVAPLAEPEADAEKASEAEEKPVAPAPTPAKPAEAAPAPTGGNFVQHMLPRDEDDWLWENDLTAATAIAELRALRPQLYNATLSLRRPQLTPMAEKALAALLGRRNQNRELEPTTASILLETILMVRCKDAGISIENESEEETHA